MNIRQTYGKGSGGAASVIESLSKYQGQSHVADNVNLSAYPKNSAPRTIRTATTRPHPAETGLAI